MKYLNRIIIYVCGIFLLALGGVIAIKSNLGASPVSSLPLSISTVTNISLGTCAAILFITYVFLQIILLKKDFMPIQLLQIIFAILFGQLMNFFNVIIDFNVNSFIIRLLICSISFFISAFGVVFTITANMVPVAPDGLVQVLSNKFNRPFGKIKIYFDCIIVVISGVILILSGNGISGLGIGTILSALLVGRIVAAINKNIKPSIVEFLFPAEVKME